MGQPGEKFDLTTFIAYLLPGLLVQVLIYLLCDSIYQLITHSSSISRILSVEAAKIGVLGIAVLIVGYLLGLLVDVCGHISSESYEAEKKTVTYTQVIENLQRTSKELPQEIVVDDESPSLIQKRNTFIDAMFYHYATVSQWSRLNWCWAFYESSRNLVNLFIPSCSLISFYFATALFINIGLDCRTAFAFSFGLAMLTGFIAAGKPCQNLKKHQDSLCQAYYRQRAYIVLGVFIDRLLSPKPQNMLVLNTDQGIRN
jgi:hypothetical protein